MVNNKTRTTHIIYRVAQLNKLKSDLNEPMGIKHILLFKPKYKGLDHLSNKVVH
jgi:hypothetical protein